MKNLIISIALIIFAFLHYSCEENFSPKTDFQQRYILNCVIRGDTTVQVASLLKSYNVPGYDPYQSNENPFISGADIRVWHNENVYYFKDTIVNGSNNMRYNGPVNFYYTSGFKPATNDSIEIRAVLPSGRTLWGKTTLPSTVNWDTSSAVSVPLEDSDLFSIIWDNPKNDLNYYLLRLWINYQVSIDGILYLKREPIPISIKVENGKVVTSYPKITKFEREAFNQSALDYAMQHLSEGIDDKEKIKVFGILSELLVFDKNLSAYYSTLNGYLDDYTIRVDESDYSNIDGGFGIFGSFIKKQGGLLIDADYIESFGYTAQQGTN